MRLLHTFTKIYRFWPRRSYDILDFYNFQGIGSFKLCSSVEHPFIGKEAQDRNKIGNKAKQDNNKRFQYDTIRIFCQNTLCFAMFLVLLTIKLCPNVQDWGPEGQYYVSQNNMKN